MPRFINAVGPEGIARAIAFAAIGEEAASEFTIEPMAGDGTSVLFLHMIAGGVPISYKIVVSLAEPPAPVDELEERAAELLQERAADREDTAAHRILGGPSW